jgi:hypothetical protein
MTEIELICKKCETRFFVNGKKNIRSFCSRKCSNSRTWSEEDKKKKSQSAKNSEKVLTANQNRILEKTKKECKCGKTFFVLPSKIQKKYCSIECSNQFAIKASGGYREGSGRSKSGHYKGIYCGSTYELCWVIYNLDHNIPFSRFPGTLTNGKIKYIPDFLQEENVIVEIKGYEQKDKVQAKIRLAEEKGYKVKILYKNDLKVCFDYVMLRYKTKTNKLYTLYDGYKPKYEYNCSLCEKSYFRDKQIKTKNTFCSKSCSMKFNRLL